MTRRLLTLPAVLLAATALLAGCGNDKATTGSSDLIDVVASTDVYGNIASVVGGDRVRVTSVLTNPDQDPHSFEANPQTTLAVSKADLLIENGGGYDDYMDTLRTAHNTDAPVINAVDLSGKTAPAGGELNEHVFYDFPTIRKVAGEIATELGDADPKHAGDFVARAKAFDGQVAALIGRENSLRTQLQGKKIGITEPVPLYLTEALGLVDATPEKFSEAVEEGDDVAPRVLHETLTLYADKVVSALVYNEQTSGPVTEQVENAARAAGIPVVGVTETLPKGATYLTWMSGNLDALATALGAR